MVAIELAYNRFCEERFTQASEGQVSSVEARIGVALPADYRNYLLEFNGGFFNEPDIISSVEGCPTDCLTFMNGIGATHPTAELASDADLALFTDNYPVQVLPIGYTIMGYLVLLVLRDEDYGTIILKTFTDSYFLANSIEDFFSLLCEPSNDQL